MPSFTRTTEGHVIRLEKPAFIAKVDADTGRVVILIAFEPFDNEAERTECAQEMLDWVRAQNDPRWN